MNETTVYDVIISGAGPVGLFLATELALARCTVLVLEKAPQLHSPLKQFPFGIRGLSAPSVEALYRRGLLDELEVPKRHKNPHAVTTPGPRQVGHFAGIPFYENDIDASQWQHRLPGSPATSLLSEMEELETVLERRALSLGVTIKRGVAITGFTQTEEGVNVQTFKGRWLVGCDGARSIVRKLGGFDFTGTEPEFTGYSAQVDMAGPEKLKPGRNLMPTGMYLQSQPGYLIIQDFDGGAFHQSEAPITAAHIQEVIRRISGTDVTINAVYAATTWTDRARQATAYRNGRVLLAGDAAHIHSPLGGQGLNLGLGDAMNLGWKLAAVIHGTAPQGLLDTYQTERYPVGEQVLDWSRAQVAIMKPGPQARALNAIMRDLIHTRDGATYIAGRVWGIFTQYNMACKHPLAGRSMPDFEFEDGVKAGSLMRDGKALLLDFDHDPLLRSIAERYGVKYAAGDVKERLGANALLVRPDGIVAWAADDNAGAEEAMALWFTETN